MQTIKFVNIFICSCRHFCGVVDIYALQIRSRSHKLLSSPVSIVIET